MADEAATFKHSISVLKNGIFARYMVAEFVSMVGSWMQTQAQQFLVEEKSGTSLDQAFISFALMIVIPIFGPLGGTLADRADKRRILFVVLFIQAMLAVAVGALVHLHVWALWHLAVVAVMLGVTHAFEGPAYSALLPEIVGRDKLGAAVALDRSIFHAGRIVGPALAGVAVAAWGTATAFYANAVSFIGPLIILCTLAPRPRGTAHEEAMRQTGFVEGWRFVRGDAVTFRMILIMAANALFCSPFVMVLLTFYARRTLGLDAVGVGWLMSLTGIGALVASFALLAIPSRKRPRYLRFGAVLSVAAMLGLAVAKSFMTAAICYGMLTLGLNFLFGIGSQIVQERAPDALRGRVSAIAGLSFVAVIPFSGILTALLDGWLGMRTALVVCAACYAVVAAVILARRWPAESN